MKERISKLLLIYSYIACLNYLYNMDAAEAFTLEYYSISGGAYGMTYRYGQYAVTGGAMPAVLLLRKNRKSYARVSMEAGRRERSVKESGTEIRRACSKCEGMMVSTLTG